MTLSGTEPHSYERGSVFRYQSFAVDAERGVLSCRYELDGREFTERVTLAPGPRWHTEAARAAARLVFLLAGVSYYKTAAPPVVDFGETALTDAEHGFLREFYLQGLGEFAYRNALDLTSLRFEAAVLAPGGRPPQTPPLLGGPIPPDPPWGDNPPRIPPAPWQRRALVPFGGGIDSIVTVERVRRLADAALFVVSRPADRFDAIEQPAAVTGLEVVRAEREIDPQLLRSAELGFLNGHVPVTGILSAIAVLAAVLEDRDAVVMSNEWSASIPTLEYARTPGQPPVFQERAVRGGLPGRAGAQPGAAARVLLLAQGPDRAVGGAGVRGARAVPRLVPELQQGFLYRTGSTARPLVRAVRQVLLHRPDPRAVPAGRGAAADLRGDRGAARRSGAGRQVPVAARRGRQAVRVRRRGHRVPRRGAAGRAAGRPGDGVTGTGLLQELAAEVAGWPDAPSDADAAAMLRPVGQNFIPAGYR